MKYLIPLITFCVLLNIAPLTGQEDNGSLTGLAPIDSLLISARTKVFTDQWPTSLEQYLLAQQIAEISNDDEYLYHIHNGLASIYYYMTDNRETGFEYQFRAYQKAQKLRDTFKLVESLSGLGEISSKMRLLVDAEDYYNQAVHLNQKCEDVLQEAILLNGLILLHKEKGAYDKVLFYFEKAKELIAQHSVPNSGYFEVLNYVHVAETYYLLGDYEKSKSHVDEAYEIIVGNTSSPMFLSNIWVLMSKNNYQLKNWELAVTYGDSAIANFFDLEPSFYDTYSNSLVKLGRQNEAIEALKKYTVTTDSLIQNKLIEKAENLRAANAIKEKITSLEYDLGLTREDLRGARERNIIYVSICCITVLILFILRSKYKKNQLAKELLEIKQKQAKEEISHKNREVIAKMLHLSNTQNVLSDVAADLEDAEKVVGDSRETRRRIRSVKSKIKTSEKIQFWKEFELRFEEVHPEFYSQLLLKHPDLTRSERVLCAYLKLNLSIKEVSQISGNTPRTVEVKRSRLRKKLGLTHKQINLNSYMQQF